MTPQEEPFRILIIDDDRGFADTQAEYLRSRGNETHAVYTFKDAEQYLMTNASRTDIALVDMYMEKDREAGLKLVELMTEQYPYVISIVVTGQSDFANAIRCMEAGAFSYIPKGEAPQELINLTIRKAFEFRKKVRVRVHRSTLADMNEKLHTLMQAQQDLVEAIHRIADEISQEPGLAPEHGA